MSHFTNYIKLEGLTKVLPYERRFFPGVKTTYLGNNLDMTPDGSWIALTSGRSSSGNSTEDVVIYNRNLLDGEISYFETITTPVPGSVPENVSISDDGLTLAFSTLLSSSGTVFVYERPDTESNFSYAFSGTGTSGYFGYACKLSADGNLLMVGAPRARFDVTNDRGLVRWWFRDSSGNWNWMGASSDIGIPSSTHPTYSSMNYGYSIDIAEPLFGTGNYSVTVGAPAAQAYASSINSGLTFHGTVDITPGGEYAFVRSNSFNYTAGISNDKFGRFQERSKDGNWLVIASGDLSVGYIRVLEYIPSQSSYYTRWTSTRLGTSQERISSLDISDDGTTIAVGKRYSNPFGKVEIYKRDFSHPTDWMLTQTITPTASNAPYNIGFGTGVELTTDGKGVLVSAPADDSPDLNRQLGESQYGSCYFFNI